MRRAVTLDALALLALLALVACGRRAEPTGAPPTAARRLTPAGTRSQPAAEPAPPPRESCDVLGRRVPLYRLRAGRSARVTATHVGGVDGPPSLSFTSTPADRADANGDGHRDYIGRVGPGDCREDCPTGVWVSCDAARHALLVAPRPMRELVFAPEMSTYRGRPWRELRETLEAVGERERVRFWHRTRTGYETYRDGARGHSDRCGALVDRGQLDAATEACRLGLEEAVEPRTIAMLHYHRGRIAEGQGDRAAAREAYQDSLRARPQSRAAQERLRAVGGTPEPIRLAP